MRPRRRTGGYLLLWGVVTVAVITLFGLWSTSTMDASGTGGLKGGALVVKPEASTQARAPVPVDTAAPSSLAAPSVPLDHPNDDKPLEIKVGGALLSLLLTLYHAELGRGQCVQGETPTRVPVQMKKSTCNRFRPYTTCTQHTNSLARSPLAPSQPELLTFMVALRY
jgi:hypothetical protein